MLKRIVNRPRPEPNLVRVTSRASGASFPSGHVTSSMVFWGWLAAWERLQEKEDPARKRHWLTRLAWLSMLLVGPSRIYLGEHWLTDVLGGYLFGIGWLSLGLQLYLRAQKSDEQAGALPITREEYFARSGKR